MHPTHRVPHPEVTTAPIPAVRVRAQQCHCRSPCGRAYTVTTHGKVVAKPADAHKSLRDHSLTAAGATGVNHGGRGAGCAHVPNSML